MKIGKRHFTVMLWLAVAAAFCLGGIANAAAPVSPVGTWDFTVSGAKLGSAYLTFGDDFTITGYILVIPAHGNAGGTDHVASFGYATLEGLWQFDLRGGIVGFLNNPPSDTIRLDIASFWGKATANGFAIKGQTEDGNLKLSGVPFVASQTSLPPFWTIEKKTKGKVIFTEIFLALPDPDLGGGNLYDLFGQGANICIFGHGALSRGNKLNISFDEFPLPDSNNCADIDPTTATGVGSAGIGKINLTTGSASLAGVQEGSPPAKVSMPVFCSDY